MPKHFDLKSLVNLYNESTGTNPEINPYFLFMLGTNTVFTQIPVMKDYENGETLSYTAQLVAHKLREHHPELGARSSPPISFSTPSVDVINGPGLFGSEVGDRVARGVFLILRALVEGKTTVQISAHSRGAVEAILIAHELDRIRKELENTTSTLFQILINTPCPYTKAAFESLFSEAEESPEFGDFLIARLTSAKINLFLIDPVPGELRVNTKITLIDVFVENLARILEQQITWKDERFHMKIPCTQVELLLCRDERSASFTPLIPKESRSLIIPGHHGTASGNIYSQQLTLVPVTIENRDTSLIQQLVVCKLLYFFNLKHSKLDVLTNNFLKASEPNKLKLLIELYNKICLNNPAYQYFSQTSYTLVGRLESATQNRLVHYGGRHNVSLESIPVLEGHFKDFVNIEHAHLYKKSAEEQQKIIERLNGSKEIHCAYFIEKRLIALTQNYLLHLVEDLKKTIPQSTEKDLESLNFTNISNVIGHIPNEYEQKLLQKYCIVKQLMHDLTDIHSSPLPSARIVKFKHCLQVRDSQLKEHRDSSWLLFFKNCMIALAVIGTGLVPGLLVLSAYSLYASKSSFSFFTQSHGEEYIDQVETSFEELLGHTVSL
jgi:hypothetical protein